MQTKTEPDFISRMGIDEEKRFNYLLIGVIAMGLVMLWFNFNLYQQNLELKQQIAGDSFHTRLGIALEGKMTQFAGQMNLTFDDLILDCNKNALMPEERIAVCFVRDRMINDSRVITIRSDFEAVPYANGDE